MMARLNQLTCMFLLLTFGFHPDCVFSVTMEIDAFTDGKRLVAYLKSYKSSKPECLLHTDGGKSLPINEHHVTVMTSSELDKYLTNCTTLRLWPDGNRRRKRQLTYPGTKWCGIGNDAKNLSDLGSEQEVDICCRDHDHCEIYILPFHNKFGLYNFSLFTCSDCGCDREFKRCLQGQLDSTTGSVIYNMYFKFLRLKCIEEKTKNVCVKSWLFMCSKYELQSKMEFSSP